MAVLGSLVSVVRSTVRMSKAVGYFGSGYFDLKRTQPATPQQRAQWLQRFAARIMRVFNIKLTVEGTFPARGALISNHLGYLDIMALAAMNPVVFCAKAEMETWPVLGFMTTMAGTVYVDRGAGGSAERAQAGMQAAANAGVPVVFFPEGTTSDGNDVLPFRSGLLAQAMAAGEPITAARIRYSIEGDNGGATVENDVAFWGAVNLLPHIFRLLRLDGVNVHVKIAPAPIRFSAPDLDRKLAAKEAREAVCAL